MTREELTTIIGMLEKIEDKRLASGRMWDPDEKCYCAQGAICPETLWLGLGRYTLALDADEFVSDAVEFVSDAVEIWAKEHGLSAEALVDLMSINDNTQAHTPEERYQKVMAKLRELLG